MLKSIRYGFWAIVGLLLILVGLANRDFATIRAMPPAFADMLGISPDVSLPMFVIIFISVGVGLFIGLLWEFLREHRLRVDGRKQARTAGQLRREVEKLKAQHVGPDDDVLALLDGPAGKA